MTDRSLLGRRWPNAAAVAAVIVVVAASTTHADEAAQRKADIQAKLADMATGTPLDRTLKADAALKSSDPLLRSLALEQALGDSDSRVRELAFVDFLKTQQSFLLQLDTSGVDFEKLSKTSLNEVACLNSLSSTQITVTDFDDQTNRFTAKMSNDGNPYPGTADRAGVTMLLCNSQPYGGTRVLLRGISDGYLIGTASWGPITVPAKIAVQ